MPKTLAFVKNVLTDREMRPAIRGHQELADCDLESVAQERSQQPRDTRPKTILNATNIAANLSSWSIPVETRLSIKET